MRGWRGAAACLGCCQDMKQPRTHDLTDASPVEQADIAATRQLARHHHHPALRAATEFSQLADQPPLLAASAAVVAWGLLSGDRHLARRGGYLVASVGLATLLKGAVKRLCRAPGPTCCSTGPVPRPAAGPGRGSVAFLPFGPHDRGGGPGSRARPLLARRGRPAYAGRRRSASSRCHAGLTTRATCWPANRTWGDGRTRPQPRLFPPAPAPGRPVRDTPRSVRRSAWGDGSTARDGRGPRV